MTLVTSRPRRRTRRGTRAGTVNNWPSLTGLDVRSEASSPNHVPGALSCPVLNMPSRAPYAALQQCPRRREESRRGARNLRLALIWGRFPGPPARWRRCCCWRGASRSEPWRLHSVRLDGDRPLEVAIARSPAVIADLPTNRHASMARFVADRLGQSAAACARRERASARSEEPPPRGLSGLPDGPSPHRRCSRV